MNELINYGDKRMTVSEVSAILGVTPEAIKKHIRELFPEIIQNGITTYLDEDQVTEIKRRMIPTTQVVGATTDAEMRQKAADVLAWLLRDNEALKARNSELAPKAAFFDQVADSKTALQMRDVAAALNIPGWGRNKLFEYLREKEILDNRNVPYRQFQDSGYFRVIEQTYTDREGETHISLKTLVYQRGVEYIRRMIEKA
jgi:phage antirepressor YoqD-like protein